MSEIAVLALEDGSVFRGTALGIKGITVGEVVFNTSMTGYQEILTDPSYAKQIVTLTYPHIGNTGINREDSESEKVWASGLIIKDLPLLASNWRKEISLTEFLVEQKITAIADVDTRRLTRLLRDKGPLNGCIVSSLDDTDSVSRAINKAREFPGLKGMDLAREVSVENSYIWEDGTWDIKDGYQPNSRQELNVVAYDFGVKRNILRMLSDRGCKVTVVPATTSASEVLAMEPDGVFLSNGPGDPEPCDYAINAVREFVEKSIPLFGICLGYQILSLAHGAKTIKMRLGHHGANHPVQAISQGNVLITSQNHGFAVDEGSLPSNLKVTHKSLFDGSLQGLESKNSPAFGFQGHPEASPGPHDVGPLFDHFIELMLKEKN